MIKVYTDGACSGNPGVGGWAAIILQEDCYKVLCDYDVYTTNNRMELIAVIEAIEYVIRKTKRIEIYSDSAYVVNAVKEGWIRKWITNDWKKSDGREVLNKDLWLKLHKLLKATNTKIIKVKGHNGNRWNEEADRMARQMVNKAKEVMDK